MLTAFTLDSITLDVPALNEPLSYLVHHGLFHVRTLRVPDVDLYSGQRMLVVQLMFLLGDAALVLHLGYNMYLQYICLQNSATYHTLS